MTNAYDIAAYYFPNYHVEPRNAERRGPSWTEWEDVKAARPRFPGHGQPKAPLWGYQDEADPAVMAHKIAAAADHGITTFIYDWYWDEEGPSLQRALDEGFLRAPNNDRLGFALMWANHWPVGRDVFDAATDHIARSYLAHPSYRCIDGRPYVSIYELHTLIQGLGGVEETRDALASFRAKALAATGHDLHLNAVLWGVQQGTDAGSVAEQNRLLARLGVDSITSYVWIHHRPLPHFPDTPYAEYARVATADWEATTEQYELPYYPNATVGWDPSPRVPPSEPYEKGKYPSTPILTGNTPEEWREVLERAKRFLDRSPTGYRMLTLYAWNEWAEGGYLEPDTHNGLAYLDAIKAVFAPTAAVGE